ncbi:MAG: DUF3748 domain-containing protein [Candidatus Marinimicrobia bacterium]|nr:DUF3748 domain-containing protein [Candidatus Neomarinimicrobiota bacterium]
MFLLFTLKLRVNGVKLKVFRKIFFIVVAGLVSCLSSQTRTEIQLTFGPYNHSLDNNDNFSPDDQWLVYDTRTDRGGIRMGQTIEKVHTTTGEIQILYTAPNADESGPGLGAVSYNHTFNRVIFIHGLFHHTDDTPYEQWRRFGMIADESDLENPFAMDARDVTSPYTPGALRGGTHRHEWSGDGKLIGFTYNDALMKALEDETGEHRNLRTIGVATPLKPVKVEDNVQLGNHSGTWFTVVVVRVVQNPKSGSDEISHAAGDSWVGDRGYFILGKWQRARAFIGTVRNGKGHKVDEVFIVDIPEDITVPGEYGSLEGTETNFPAPPMGTVQRRLTFTAETDQPDCVGIVRATKDGSQIAFLAKDKNGIRQVFTVSPTGGKAVMVTNHSSDVQGSLRWSPNGKQISYIWDNSVVVKDIDNSSYTRITKKTEKPPGNLVWSHDGNTIAFNRNVMHNSGNSHQQIFTVNLGKGN